MLSEAAAPWLFAIVSLAATIAASLAWRWSRPPKPRFRNTLGGTLVLTNLSVIAAVALWCALDFTADAFAIFMLSIVWLFAVSVPLHVTAPRQEVARMVSTPHGLVGLAQLTDIAGQAKIVAERGVDAYVLVVLVMAFAATLIYTAKEHRREHEEDRAAIERAEKRAEAAELALRDCLARQGKEQRPTRGTAD